MNFQLPRVWLLQFPSCTLLQLLMSHTPAQREPHPLRKNTNNNNKTIQCNSILLVSIRVMLSHNVTFFCQAYKVYLPTLLTPHLHNTVLGTPAEGTIVFFLLLPLKRKPTASTLSFKTLQFVRCLLQHSTDSALLRLNHVFNWYIGPILVGFTMGFSSFERRSTMLFF